jgi:hypothetical protein
MEHLLLPWETLEQRIEAHRQLISERGERIWSNAYLDEIKCMNRALQAGACVSLQIASAYSHQAPDAEDPRMAAWNVSPTLKPCVLVLQQIVVGDLHTPAYPDCISHSAYYLFWNETLQRYDSEASAVRPHRRWPEMLAQIEGMTCIC